MLITVAIATFAGWLALWAVLAARFSAASSRAAAARRAPPAGPEPPAVVSLLAGRLHVFGYPATLLDLAARGLFRLEPQPDGPAMCVLTNNHAGGGLTDYERAAYAHLMTRAGSRVDIPAAALSDGFAGPAARDGALKSAKDAFMEAFTADVIADSRRRGLTRPRLSDAGGCLLWVAGLIPAIVTALAVHADKSHAYWVPVVGFTALCTLSGIAVRGEKLTPAGQAALRHWRDRCSGHPATAAVAPAGWPAREVAYAAALGRARAAVKLFAESPGQPRGKAMWSSYGGHWRLIAIGDPAPRGVLQVGGVLVSMLAVVLFALLPPTLATVILAHGELRAAAVGVIAVDVVIAVRLLTKSASIPAFAEFDGQVIEAWIEEETHGENSHSTSLCLAIDDGVRDQAWVFSVTSEQYRRFTPGTLVHAQVNPRRNTLLDIRPLTDSARLPRR